jgi:hypothetical protein
MNASLASELLAAWQEPRASSADRATTRSVRQAPPIGPAIFPSPEPAGDRAELLPTLERRTSTRFFDRSTISLTSLVAVVQEGLEADRLAWDDTSCTFEVSVVAFRVSGVPEAIYRLNPFDGMLTPIAEVPPGEGRHNLTIQREFADAATIISLAANLGEIDESAGPHGYRMAMTRAGAAAYTMWLSAVSRGLTGTVFAGFIPASVRRPLYSDGSSRHQLFALALGVPVATP